MSSGDVGMINTVWLIVTLRELRRFLLDLNYTLRVVRK